MMITEAKYAAFSWNLEVIKRSRRICIQLELLIAITANDVDRLTYAQGTIEGDSKRLSSQLPFDCHKLALFDQWNVSR